MSDEAATFPDDDAQVAPLLVVGDIGRSVDFYCNGMGASVVMQWDTYARLRLAQGTLHLATPSVETPDKPGVSLTLPTSARQVTGEVVIQVTDCRTTYAQLSARGMQFLAAPSEPPWGGEVRCFLQDPDGHLIELSQTDPSQRA